MGDTLFGDRTLEKQFVVLDYFEDEPAVRAANLLEEIIGVDLVR
jgi:hypothetical protein